MNTENLFPDPKMIYDDWTSDPKRPIFLVDETRKPVYDTHDEIILYTCVGLYGLTAQTIMTAAARARTTDESFKGRDLKRPEVQKGSAQLIGVWCQSLQLIEDIKIVATTANAQKILSKSAKARLHTTTTEQAGSDRPNTIEGRELNTVIHLLLKMAIDLKIGARQIDAILDRSDQIGVGHNKRGLARGLMEVLGPDRLDVRPDGSQASLECPALFRLIAGSDDGMFRDLLMLPDFYGYLLNHETNHKELYRTLMKEQVWLLPFDIAKAKQAQRTFTSKT